LQQPYRHRPNHDDLLTVGEVAELLDIDRHAVSRAMRRIGARPLTDPLDLRVTLYRWRDAEALQRAYPTKVTP